MSCFCLHLISSLLTKAAEPGQTQVAENRVAYVLLKLIKDGILSENEALLDFAYELIELAAEQGTFRHIKKSEKKSD